MTIHLLVGLSFVMPRVLLELLVLNFQLCHSLPDGEGAWVDSSVEYPFTCSPVVLHAESALSADGVDPSNVLLTAREL